MTIRGGRYTNKPVTIDAFQVRVGDAMEDWPQWMHDAIQDKTVRQHRSNQNLMFIDTLEGTMTAGDDDWIIRNPAGDLFPCRPSFFEKTYVRADGV